MKGGTRSEEENLDLKTKFGSYLVGEHSNSKTSKNERKRRGCRYHLEKKYAIARRQARKYYKDPNLEKNNFIFHESHLTT